MEVIQAELLTGCPVKSPHLKPQTHLANRPRAETTIQ
jgi:hypothetical protein